MKKDMIKFYLKLLVFQIIFYSLFALMSISNGVTNDGKIVIPWMALTFFIVSVLVTVIVPLFKLFQKD